MGWFLTGKPKRKKPIPRPPVTLAKPWDPRRTLAGAKILFIIILSLALAVGWWQLEDRLIRYVGTHGQMLVAPRQVELIKAPSWMSPKIKEELRVMAAAQVNSNPLDQQGLKLAAAAPNQNPWIQEVRQIRRLAGGRLQVDATYRLPVAWVYESDGLRMVDGAGVVLPGLYLRGQAAAIPLPVIRGVAAWPVAPGCRWQAPQLEAGLALVRFLSGESYMNQVDSIDVSGRDSRGRIRLALRTRQGGTVHWGLPPGQEESVEPPAATKRLWLAQINRDSGAIDVGGRVVDIFGPAVLIHFPSDTDKPGQAGYTLAQ